MNQFGPKVYIKTIPYHSEEYFELLTFREKWLKIPLGIRLTEQDVWDDKEDFHIGLYVDDLLKGSCVLKVMARDTIRMRQVAVDDQLRGLGYGRRLVDFSEQLAKEKEFRWMILHARHMVVGFYEKLGYAAEGNSFIEVGMEHYMMKKYLG